MGSSSAVGRPRETTSPHGSRLQLAGERGEARSGLATAPPPAAHLASLVELLEGLGHAALLIDRRGAVLAETRHLHALAARFGCAAALRAAGARLLLTAALGRSTSGSSPRPSEAAGPMAVVSIGSSERMMLRLLDPPSDPAMPSVVLASVEVLASSPEQYLADQFGLTAREVPVALLLGRGASVSHVASRLGISVHTVRRHGESVYRKLGIRSRAALAGIVARLSLEFSGGGASSG